MATYYVVSAILFVVLIFAATTIVIYALNKKGDVSAGLWLNRVGFTLSAKERPEKVKRR
jgi:hypothetical protein